MLHFFEIFTQNRPFGYLSLILLAAFALFLVSWLLEPRRLLNGLLFTAFLIVLAIWLTVLFLTTNLPTLILTYEIVLVLVIAAVTLIAGFSWLFFLWNAYFVWKHERHTLTNLLTLFTGLLLLAVWIIIFINPLSSLPAWLRILLYAPIAIIIYLLLVAYNFLVNLALYQLVPRRYDQDYLIILGAGLANGETVTPLLAGRINRAIEFALKQVAKGRKMPKLIMSGGQGGDEKVTEAQAMAEYALARGIAPANILCETKSTNTYQNMQYSAQLAANDFGSKNYRARFFSNNYHIFRAALYAKAVGLNANGVGCYTRFYFLPTAVVREFAGILLINKKRHFIVVGAITIFFVICALLEMIGIHFLIR